MMWTEDQLLDYKGWKTKPLSVWDNFDRASFWEHNPNTSRPEAWLAWHKKMTGDNPMPKSNIGKTMYGIWNTGGAVGTVKDERGKEAEKLYSNAALKVFSDGLQKIGCGLRLLR